MQVSIRAARANINMSQTELAGFLNVSSSTLSRWEHGEGTIPEDKLLKLCSICHIKRENLKIHQKGKKDGQ